MKGIPVSLVKANQSMLVALTTLSILLQNVWILLITFLIIMTSLIFGGKANIAFIVKKMITKRDLSQDDTESAVLTRFNQSIAASLLFVGLLVLFISEHWIGWVFVAMVTVAATVALLGFCIGCFMYFQFKQLKYKWKTRNSN
ncbi:DUF4395 domain-containing protein [Evansella cellulosilytica]|uniref:DUF4395 domain-containing protein n=1 Tax=Evansella cellulosilytica (strain ATCC 21833 / DSM 2522 / FERM P-1141 / JCM 9156 / N-4) TaxID=649639 RepID=E6U0C7_EVAC2|nr:DUF4395 domain-containing protein [Evansella cellulosilytica]ADU30243.1 hypothetical protein Bcell_1981 [Evansella cellulosilytica DSM 2522]